MLVLPMRWCAPPPEAATSAIRAIVDAVADGLAAQRARVVDAYRETSVARGKAALSGLGFVRQVDAVITSGASAVGFLGLIAGAMGTGLSVRSLLKELWGPRKLRQNL